MKRNIFNVLSCGILGLGIALAFNSCKNGDVDFPDYENGTTVYFPYQYPVRTIALCDEEYDTSLDQQHKCQILATFGGSYNGSNGSVQVAVDERLCENLFFEDGVTPVKPMPASFYELSTTNLEFNGTMNGRTTVSLTKDFFDNEDAVKETYVIPLVMISQTGFTRILTGELNEGQSGPRTDASVWDVKPMDYVLYCVKYQNKYSGWWLTNGNTSIDNIEKGKEVQVKTRTLNSSIYTVSYQDGSELFTADLLLDFNGDNCTISSLTSGVTATGTGSWKDNGAGKAWGNRERDLMELNYTVDFGGGHKWSTNEKLVWQRSGITIEEFAPVYVK